MRKHGYVIKHAKAKQKIKKVKERSEVTSPAQHDPPPDSPIQMPIFVISTEVPRLCI